MIATMKNGAILYVQCKNWESKIGVETIRSFHGALNKYNSANSMGLIVGNTFTEHAKDKANIIKGPPIILTTLEDIERTIVKILTESREIIKPYNIKIENATYIEITRKEDQIISIGDNVNAEIK